MMKNIPLACAAAALLLTGSLASADSATPAHPLANKAAAAPVKRAPMKANSTGLALRYTVPDTIKAGVATPLRIELSGARGDDARVELRASQADIVVTQDGRALPGPIALPRGAVRTMDLVVTVPADGIYHLSVLMSQGGRRAVAAVPLRVGSAALSRKAEGTPQTTPSGERVISMPAK